jgi:hypothetical protein
VDQQPTVGVDDRDVHRAMTQSACAHLGPGGGGDRLVIDIDDVDDLGSGGRVHDS